MTELTITIPFLRYQTLSNFQEFANNNSKFDEHGRKFSNMVENKVEKGEIARHEQFLLFPLCFQKTCKNQGLFGKGIHHIFLLVNFLKMKLRVFWPHSSFLENTLNINPYRAGTRSTIYHTMPHLDALKIYSCGKHCEKRRK